MSNPLAADAKPQVATPRDPPGHRGQRPATDFSLDAITSVAGGAALLADIIESMPGAICVYGPDLHVMALNRAYRDLYPLLADVLIPGAPMSDVLGAAIDRDVYPCVISDRQAFIKKRIERRQRMGANTIQRMTKRHDAWIHIRESRSADGCIICVHTDITERKRNKDARRESEARFRTAFEDAPAGMMIATLDGTCIQANQPMSEMLGYEAGRLVDVSVADLVHADDRDEYDLHARKLISGDIDHFIVEQRFSGRDARVIWANCSVSLLKNGAHQPVNAIWQVQDITERKAAEEALKESEGRLRAIMDNSPAVIFLRDSRGRYLLANKAYEQRWGLAPGEAIGKSLRDLFPPDLASTFLESDRQVVSNGLTAREGKLILPSGEERTTLVSKFPLPGADGTPQAVGVISQDITELKAAEEALRASEARLRAIVENSPAAVFLRDKAGRYIVANKEFHRRYDMAPGSAIGTHPLDILSVERANSVLELDKEIMDSRQSISREHIVTRPNGERRNVLYVKFPIIREDGEVESVGIISTDMTEIRRAESRLRQLQSELTHAYRLNIMGEMATGLAHELNQPLSAIVNYAQGCVRRLQSGVDCADELVSVMNKISDQAQRAGSIIRWMRGFVRKGGDDKATVDLNSLIRECAEIMDHEFDRHNIQLTMNLDQRLPPVFADRIQVQQVVLNLVRNGVEALMESDHVGRLITVSSVTREDQAEVSVIDNGPGIADETRARLFDPFYTTKEDGLGMGLSICRTVIEAHGGRLSADSEESEGSIFRFSIPFRGRAPEDPVGPSGAAT